MNRAGPQDDWRALPFPCAGLRRALQAGPGEGPLGHVLLLARQTCFRWQLAHLKSATGFIIFSALNKIPFLGGNNGRLSFSLHACPPSCAPPDCPQLLSLPVPAGACALCSVTSLGHPGVSPLVQGSAAAVAIGLKNKQPYKQKPPESKGDRWRAAIPLPENFPCSQRVTIWPFHPQGRG